MTDVHYLRENDNNEIEVLTREGEVVDKIEGWRPSVPFRDFDQRVSVLASRYNAASFVELDGRMGPTIHGYLTLQEDLYDKARRDRLTDY